MPSDPYSMLHDQWEAACDRAVYPPADAEIDRLDALVKQLGEALEKADAVIQLDPPSPAVWPTLEMLAFTKELNAALAAYREHKGE